MCQQTGDSTRLQDCRLQVGQGNQQMYSLAASGMHLPQKQAAAAYQSLPHRLLLLGQAYVSKPNSAANTSWPNLHPAAACYHIN
jgi:hypothetical protein